MGDRWRFFGYDSKYLDRFGLLLALTMISASVLSLVDLDDPDESARSEVGWLLVSFTVGFSLLAALRASGVTRRWQRMADVFIGLTGVPRYDRRQACHVVLASRDPVGLLNTSPAETN